MKVLKQKIKIQACICPTTLCNQRIFSNPGIFISYIIWGMPWCGIIQPNREMPLRLHCWMCISSNCGTAVDVVGPICQGPTKTPMGVQHPTRSQKVPIYRAKMVVVERICLLESGHTWRVDCGVRQGFRRLLVGIQRDISEMKSGRRWEKKADDMFALPGWREDLEDSS